MKRAVEFHPDRTGKGVPIAIIDSGVHAEHPHVAGVAGGIFVHADGSLSDDYVDRLGHGTAVAAAIREKAPAAGLYAVKIFSDSLAAPIAALIRAIDWAAEAGARLINLSLGTSGTGHEAALLEAVKRAQERNAVLVAACEDSGVRWLPGSLPGVLPVRLDWSLSRHEYHAEQNERIVFRASGYPRPIPGIPPERNIKGISFAVANMTGFCARALEAYPEADLGDLIDVLADPKLRPQTSDLRPQT